MMRVGAAQFLLGMMGLILVPATLFAELDASAEYRDEIQRSLFEFYEREKRRSSVVDTIEFIEREGTQQPIRVVHNRNIESEARVLVLAIDDGARGLFPDSVDTVIVGLPLADRIKDLVPPISGEASPGTMEWLNSRVTTPDSKQLLAFLEEILLPYLEEKYGPFSHRSLFGHSYGGLFAIEALLARPRLFDSYIASSPSLWYSYDYYEALAIDAAKTPDISKNRCLILSAGEDEAAISSGVRKFQRLLQGLNLPLLVHHQRNAEIDHAHNRSIAFAYGWDRIFNTDDLLPPMSAIAAPTVVAFNQYLTDWHARNSCTSNFPIKNASAYADFASKLADEKNWSEMRLLHQFLVESVPLSSRSFGTVLHGFLRQFEEFPQLQKEYWSARYKEYLDRKPYSNGEIHHLDDTIIEYISNH